MRSVTPSTRTFLDRVQKFFWDNVKLIGFVIYKFPAGETGQSQNYQLTWSLVNNFQERAHGTPNSTTASVTCLLLKNFHIPFPPKRALPDFWEKISHCFLKQIFTFHLNFHVRTDGERADLAAVQTNGVQVAVNLECGLTRLRRPHGRAPLQDSAETRVSSPKKAISRLSLSLSLSFRNIPIPKMFRPPIYSHPIFRNNLTFPTATSGERTSKWGQWPPSLNIPGPGSKKFWGTILNWLDL